MRRTWITIVLTAIASSAISLTIAAFLFNSSLFDYRAKKFVAVSFLGGILDSWKSNMLGKLAESSCTKDSEDLIGARKRWDSVLGSQASFIASLRSTDSVTFSKKTIRNLTNYGLLSESFVDEVRNSVDSIIDLRMSNTNYLIQLSLWTRRVNNLDTIATIAWEKYVSANRMEPNNDTMGFSRYFSEREAAASKAISDKWGAASSNAISDKWEAGDHLDSIVKAYKDRVLPKKVDEDD